MGPLFWKPVWHFTKSESLNLQHSNPTPNLLKRNKTNKQANKKAYLEIPIASVKSCTEDSDPKTSNYTVLKKHKREGRSVEMAKISWL